MNLQKQGYTSLFVFENYPNLMTENDFFKITQVSINETNHYPLTCLVKTGSPYQLQLISTEEHFNAASLQQLGLRYIKLLEEILQKNAVNELDFLLSSELPPLTSLNNTVNYFDNILLLPQKIHQSARRHPNHIALMFNDTTFTYAAIDLAARKVSSTLHKEKLISGDIVAIMLPRSIEMIEIIIGCMYAGIAFLPMDPNWPEARVSDILQNSQSKLLICEKPLLESKRQNSITTISVNACKQFTARDEIATINSDLAYIMYTSGSTGKPKGVMITHEAIANRIHWMQAQYGLKPSETVLHKTPIIFDVSLWEFLWPLAYGGKCVIAPDKAHIDPKGIQKLIETHKINYLHFIPSMLNIFLSQLIAPSCSSLTAVPK